MKEYKQWIRGIKTSDLSFEQESMSWVSSFGSTEEVKRTASEKLQVVREEIKRREGYSNVA
jgi:hypothetical protein